MIDVKRFSGILNTDDDNYSVLQPQHIGAKNIRFVGGQNGQTAQNIVGNYKIANSLLPGGNNANRNDNECIGAFFDRINNKIIWFNWNSTGKNGIYSLDINTEAVTRVFECFTNSASDVLGFDRNYPIHSCAIVYRDDGNLLYWTDGKGIPMYLNMSTVATLSPFTVDMLAVAKTPPSSPPTSTYKSDATKVANFVKNRYFRFANRWVYENFEKSTFSPTSELPIPALSEPQNEIQATQNNYIEVVFSASTRADFKSMELYAQEFNGSSWGDFFLIDSVDKSDIGGSTYTFNFYNDGTYPVILPSESDLRFDWIPDKANTLELLNGNVIIYGGVTEGYNALKRSDVNVQITATTVGETSNNVIPVYRWANNERFGLIYFDKFGKTNGVVSFLADASIDTNNFNVTTPDYQGGALSHHIPKISASINHLPPSWAETYQWVRMDLAPPFFLQYWTNDLQTDSSFMYLCIQSLINNNSKFGFVPSYEFQKGDRVRVMGYVSGSFSPILDFQILEVVERTMNGTAYTPATSGSFLKIKKAAGVVLGYPNYLIEIYTPSPNQTDETAVFWEFGEKYNITGGYHMGQTQNQTAVQPALFEWTEGYVYRKLRTFPGIIDNTTMGSDKVMDRNYNDFQQSKANSNSRGWPIDINAKTQYYGTTLRWGGSYLQDTNINNLNRFFPSDLDAIDRSRGDIRRLKARDRILRVFQDRSVGQYGIYSRYIQNNEGETQLTTTNEIITANNINYYSGFYGVGQYPTNLTSTPYADYFTDMATGRGIRLGADGFTDLGVLYKGQYTFPKWVLNYSQTILRSNGTKAKVMAFFDDYDNDFHTILQGGTANGNTYQDRHFAFHEPRLGYVCDHYDYHPEWAISANGITYTWDGGHLWKHSVMGDNYCNFYGTQYDSEITFVFNQNIYNKKSWLSICQTGSDIWESPTKGDIYTDTYSYSGQVQQSKLKAANFSRLESKFNAAFFRDENSRGGWVNGDSLKGSILVIKLIKQNANKLITLLSIDVNFVESPLNLK